QFPVEWHPSGNYLFVEVEKPMHAGSSTDAIPGYGAYTDLWVITPDGKAAWKLVDEPEGDDHALTHMTISADGSKIAGPERVKAQKALDATPLAGAYLFNPADFASEPSPALTHIAPHRPGNVDQGGEVDGMSADGHTLAFYSS